MLGAVAAPTIAFSQDSRALQPESLALVDLESFRDPPENWRVVGHVASDRSREQSISTVAGSGVLANVASSGRGGDLWTAWEHGDIDIEMEFMMPRASNSGVYLQGRYELQLLDSWGVENPTYGDVGGIYHRWDESRGAGREGYEGHAPRVNAARAPGLWQTLRIEFRAPRFDAQGNKISNARFARVELNGAVLHENIELTGPTRGAFLPGEAATGPLVIQGDHGPVAFRDIRYKRYEGRPLTLSELRFRAYEGEFQRFPELAALTPARSGSVQNLSAAAAGVADRFALVHDGVIDIPSAGRYLLDLRLNWLDAGSGDNGARGGARLSIGGRDVLLHDGRQRSMVTEVDLAAGRQAFTLEMFKNREGRPASFTLFAEGPGVARQALHAEAAPTRGSAEGAIRVRPTDEPYVLRSFVDFGEEKRTHVISVGEPAGIHYSYDAEQGAILSAWRGPFMETTEMWSGRGEPQLAVPLGSVITLDGAPALAVLGDQSAAWPDSMLEATGYQFLGYDLDEARRPVYRYRIGSIGVEDRLRPADEGRGLARGLRLTGPEGGAGAYVRVAAGEEIERLRDGSYVVDGRFYVVPVRDTPGPVLRAVPGGQELLVPVAFRRGEARVAYELVW